MGILEKLSTAKLNILLSALILALWGTRLVTFAAFPKPISAPDSGTYYSGDFLNFELVSLTGHAPRGWFVPLLYAVMPNSVALEFMQLSFSAAVWTFLLVTIANANILNPKPTRILLVLLMILGSSAQVIQHDTTILATSINNSLFILILAFLIRIKFLPVYPKFYLLCILVIGFFLSIQKTTFLTIAIVFISLGLYSVRRILQPRAITSFVIIALFSGLFVVSVGTNVNNTWQVSYSGQTLLWQLGGQSPVAEDFSQYLDEVKAPSCITEDAPYDDLDISIGKILNDCPGGVSYLKSSIQRDFFFFALSHPQAVAKLAIFGMGAALSDSASNYGNAVSIFPKSFSEVFFGESSPDISNTNIESQVAGMDFLNSGKPFWIFTPLIFWVLFGLCGVLFSRAQRKENLYLLTIVAANLSQAIFAVVLLPSEWVRQTSPFILGTLIFSAILSLKFVETIFVTRPSSGS